MLLCRNYERPYLAVFLCWMYGDCVDYDSFESIYTGCDHTYFSTNVNIFGFFIGIFGHNSHFLGTFSSLRGVLYSDSHFIFSPISFYITRLGEGTCIQIRNYVNFERNNMYPSQRHNIIIKQFCYFIFNDHIAGSSCLYQKRETIKDEYIISNNGFCLGQNFSYFCILWDWSKFLFCTQPSNLQNCTLDTWP